MSNGQWTGRLDRGADGTVAFTLTDAWGWSITGTGVRDPERGGYLLTATTGEVPKALRVPAIDDNE